MKNEIWKDVTGFEGLYQVSNLGRVKSLERKCEVRNIHRHSNVHNEEWVRKEKILEPIGKYGIVHLHDKNHIRHNMLVKVLVAREFLDDYSFETTPQSIYCRNDKDLRFRDSADNLCIQQSL